MSDAFRKQQDEEQLLQVQLAEEHRQRKAERHQARQLRRLKREEAQRMNYKIAVEERKLLIAQRKLESIRLLDELFERVKVRVEARLTVHLAVISFAPSSEVKFIYIHCSVSLISLYVQCCPQIRH